MASAFTAMSSWFLGCFQCYQVISKLIRRVTKCIVKEIPSCHGICSQGARSYLSTRMGDYHKETSMTDENRDDAQSEKSKANIVNAPCGSQPSFGWQSILHGRDLLKKGMRYIYITGWNERLIHEQLATHHPEEEMTARPPSGLWRSPTEERNLENSNRSKAQALSLANALSGTSHG
ncbi:unnamed protein product [Arabidopsis halleri]